MYLAEHFYKQRSDGLLQMPILGSCRRHTIFTPLIPSSVIWPMGRVYHLKATVFMAYPSLEMTSGMQRSFAAHVLLFAVLPYWKWGVLQQKRLPKMPTQHSSYNVEDGQQHI
jgi:hypothetical protein